MPVKGLVPSGEKENERALVRSRQSLGDWQPRYTPYAKIALEAGCGFAGDEAPLLLETSRADTHRDRADQSATALGLGSGGVKARGNDVSQGTGSFGRKGKSTGVGPESPVTEGLASAGGESKIQ